MAGERKASLTLRAGFFGVNDYVEIWFKNHYERFTAKYPGNMGANDFDVQGSQFTNLKNAIVARINSLGLSSEYLVTTGTVDISGTIYATITITAVEYGNIYTFQGCNIGNVDGGPTPIYEHANLSNINPITVTAETTFITCGGSITGNISLTTAETVGAVTYQWSNGVTTSVPSLNNIPAGNYSVTVIDSQGTSTVLNNIIVEENARIEIQGIVNGRDINIEVTGGVAPYFFKWADGPTTQNRTGLNTGNYTITVTDSNGCQRAGSFLVKNEWFHFSQNPIALSLSASNYLTKPNLSFICEVWIEEVYLSNNFTLAYTGEQPADSLGKTTFYVEEVLDSYLQAHFPAFGQTTVTKATSAFKRFQLKYREKYGTPPIAAAVSTGSIEYVVLGGLDFEEQAARTFFSSYLTYQKPFFSWQPQIKRVLPDQPEYLFFMPIDAGTTVFTVKSKLYFPQGTSETYQLFSQTGARQFELWIIPAGFQLLKLQNRAGNREVLRYEIWVEDTASGKKVSETRIYQLDQGYFRTKRYFHYLNSLGGIDTLLATGAASLNLQVETETAARNILPGYNAIYGDQVVVSRGGRPFLTLSTGYQLSRNERISLQDLRYSKDVKMLSEDRYVAGQLIFKDNMVDDEFADAKALDFEFRMAFRQHYSATLKRKGYAVPVEALPEPNNPTQDL